MKSALYIPLATLAVIFCSIRVSFQSNASYTKLYEDGIKAYRDERWFECFNRIQQAIERHHEHIDLLIQCRLLCQRAGTLPDVETLSSVGYVIAVNSAECSRRCLRDGGEVEGPKGDSGAVEKKEGEDFEMEFEQLMPYDYLQICAYHSGHIPTAMSAAYTFSLAHPNHEYMAQNIELYRNHPDAKDTYLVNLEEQKHQAQFEIGARYYSLSDYPNTVAHMEEAVREYYIADERCSALCDKPVDDSSLKSISKSDMFKIKAALYDHWISVLQCKEQCPVKMATMRGKLQENYHVELYNYLQYSYYKLNQMKLAAQCTSTYLMFKPNSESMQRNKNIYVIDPQVNVVDFEPRQDAKQYYNRKEREHRMLEELMKKKMELESQAESQENNEGSTAGIKSSLEGVQFALFNKDSEHYTVSVDDYMTSRGLMVSMESETLLGNRRVVIDGLLSKQQCRSLLDVYRATSANSDASSKRKMRSEFSEVGVTMDAASALAREGRLESQQAYEYLNAVDGARAAVEKYFQVESALLFQHSRLHCSSADNDKHDDDDDDDVGTGVLEAESDDDIVAILYLTDDFTGGEFSFTFTNYTVQKTIPPLIGRLIAMGGTNQYRMSNVQSGERCVISMTFTRNPASQLPAYSRALCTLKRMGAPDWNAGSEELNAYIEEKGYKIVQTDLDLNGPERFTADHMSNYNQCQRIIELANKMAVMGDGYQHSRAGKTRSSPHTDYEKFVGLTIRRAAELAAEYKVSAESVELYLRIVEEAMELTRLYFKLDQLYFAYIHLVCRTALDDAVSRHDLSHPIHTDNSVMQPDGTTKRKRPAYIERDYSAIVYLNGDFKGGDFFFAHQNFSIQSSIHPHCGMMVSFNAGNYHGVRAVESGQRCAIALWFTRDKRYEDTSADFARDVLKQLSSGAFGPNQNPRRVEL